MSVQSDPIVMLKSLLIVTFVLSLFIVVAENQGIGYAVSMVRSQLTVPDGVTPEHIMAGGISENGATTLLVVGDIAECGKETGPERILPVTAHLLGFTPSFDTGMAKADETAKLAGDWPTAPILALGDLVYENGSPAEFEGCFDTIWGKLKPRILPTPGNHEYNTPGAFGYYDYWGLQAGPDRRGYYAVHIPGWLILSLNSETDAGPGSKQSAWLHHELAQSTDSCILAFYHKPAHSLLARSGSEDAVALFTDLYRAGASLVLNGHNHFYERTEPLDASGAREPNRGIIGFTIGTGGRVSEPIPERSETADAVFGRTGVLKLELRDGSYSWAYVDALSGHFFDKGTQDCNPARWHG